MNIREFLDNYGLQEVNIAFRNQTEENTVMITFDFKTRKGSIQRNVFRYKADPQDEESLLVQVMLQAGLWKIDSILTEMRQFGGFFRTPVIYSSSPDQRQ